MNFVFELDPRQEISFGYLRGHINEDKRFVAFEDQDIQLSMALEYRKYYADDLKVIEYCCIGVNKEVELVEQPSYAIVSLEAYDRGIDYGWSVMNDHIFQMIKTILDREPSEIIDAPWPLWYFLLDDRFAGYCQEIYVTAGSKSKGQVLQQWYDQKLYIQEKRVLAEIQHNNSAVLGALSR